MLLALVGAGREPLRTCTSMHTNTPIRTAWTTKTVGHPHVKTLKGREAAPGMSARARARIKRRNEMKKWWWWWWWCAPLQCLYYPWNWYMYKNKIMHWNRTRAEQSNANGKKPDRHTRTNRRMCNKYVTINITRTVWDNVRWSVADGQIVRSCMSICICRLLFTVAPESHSSEHLMSESIDSQCALQLETWTAVCTRNLSSSM